MYSAYVMTKSARDGSIQHVIANGVTAKGMTSDLRRYVAKMSKHSPHSIYAKVHLWCVTGGVYDVKRLSDYM